jgi:hypothetical protein
VTGSSFSESSPPIASSSSEMHPFRAKLLAAATAPLIDTPAGNKSFCCHHNNLNLLLPATPPTSACSTAAQSSSKRFWKKRENAPYSPESIWVKVGCREGGRRELRMSTRVTHPTIPTIHLCRRRREGVRREEESDRWRGLDEWWISFLWEKERVGCCSWEDGGFASVDNLGAHQRYEGTLYQVRACLPA